MPRPMHGKVPEKSKDFTGSIKRLFNSLNKFKYLLIFALVLGFVSAILALITPNKLSNLTNLITTGIKPNITEKTITKIMSSEKISNEDKEDYLKYFYENN